MYTHVFTHIHTRIQRFYGSHSVFLALTRVNGVLDGASLRVQRFSRYFQYPAAVPRFRFRIPADILPPKASPFPTFAGTKSLQCTSRRHYHYHYHQCLRRHRRSSDLRPLAIYFMKTHDRRYFSCFLIEISNLSDNISVYFYIL